jgi:hypothetical protein
MDSRGRTDQNAVVRTTGWAWLFLATGGVTVAEASLELDLVPYAGTLATLALLGLAASRHRGTPRPAALAGLAALTLAAGIIDTENGGHGWPRNFDSPSLLEATLVIVGAALVAVDVLDRVAPGLRKRRLWPAALAAFILLIHLVRTLAAVDEVGRPPVLAVAATRVALILPVIALALVVLATNAAFASGRRFRWAGAGLLTVGVLAVGVLGSATSARTVLYADDLSARTDTAEAARQTDALYRAILDIDAARLGPTAGDSTGVAVWAYSDGLTLQQRETIERLPTETAVAVEPGEWSSDPWQSEPDWPAIRAALLTLALLGGLAALTVGLFPGALRE